MRITAQQMALLQDIKQNVKGQVQLQVGEILTGKVLAVQTEALLIALEDGSSLRALVDQPERFLEGQTIEFEVKEHEMHSLPKLEITSSKSQVQVKQVLSQVDIPPTKENVKAYEVLKSLDLSITKENITTLTSHLKFLVSIDKGIEPLVMQEHEDVQWHQKEDQPRILNQLAEKLGYEHPEQLKEAPLKEVVLKILDIPVGKDGVENEQKNVDVPVVKQTVPAEIIKEIFGLVREQDTLNVEHTMEKLGQLLKLDKPLTLKSLSILSKLSIEGSKIGDQLKNFIKELPEHERSVLKEMAKGLPAKAFESKEQVKVFFDTLMTEVKQVSQTSTSTRVKASAEELMTSIQFMEQDQDDIAWLQVPFQMNAEQSNLDVYFKRDKKSGSKLTKDAAKILVALNTHYLDLVQAVIEVKQKTLNITFNVQHESIKSLIEHQKGRLISFWRI